MTKIRIPTPLRLYTAGQNCVSVSGKTVGEALFDLTQKYPDLQQHLYDGEELRSFVNVYLNKEDVRHMDGEKTAVTADDTLMIIPSIAGGQPHRNEEELI
jgi:molybdopterin synthase sulfur carrier subunit